MKESLLPETGPGFVSEDDEERRYVDNEYRYSISVFLENLEGDVDDMPEMPPLFVVKFPELVEKSGGWQRLIPYVLGVVDWGSYKAYLEEYLRQNDGEVAALCANKKPDKDKSYFVRDAARRANKRAGLDGHAVASDCYALCADSAARQCINFEHEFRWTNYLPTEEVELSNGIEDFANRVIKSAGEYSPTAVSGLVCIAKETELLVELLDVRRFRVSDLISLSKKVRRSAFNLVLRAVPESSTASGAMVGMAKEAKFMCYLLSREDDCIERELDMCSMVRKYTERAFTKLLEEFACKTPSNGVSDYTPASAKSEKHIGVSTNGCLNCKESGSMQDFKIDLKECCGKDNTLLFRVAHCFVGSRALHATTATYLQ